MSKQTSYGPEKTVATQMVELVRKRGAPEVISKSIEGVDAAAVRALGLQPRIDHLGSLRGVVGHRLCKRADVDVKSRQELLRCHLFLGITAEQSLGQEVGCRPLLERILKIW